MTKLWQRLLMQQSAPPAATGYRYWRLDFAAVTAGFLAALDEVWFCTSIGGPTVTTPATPVIASSQAGANYGPARVVDGRFWDSGAGNYAWASLNNSQPEFLAFDLGSPTNIAQIVLFASEYTNCKAPGTFTASGSNVATSGPWTSVASFSGPARGPKTGSKTYNL